MNLRIINVFLIIVSLALYLYSCSEGKQDKEETKRADTGDFHIGWASADITPDSPVLIGGQFYARISEGILDPITVTALALESCKETSTEKAIMISCDLISIPDGSRDGSGDNLRDNVRKLVKESLPELLPDQIIINATHTHSAPYCSSANDSKSLYGAELTAMPPSEYQKYITERIAGAAVQAWKNRNPGGISYGLGHAVVGQNRLVVDTSGKSLMYGAAHTNREEFGNTNKPEFSHIEGYEDHSVNLLYTWDNKNNLTGVVINIAAPSQVSMHSNLISADYWHDTRVELRQRLGKDFFILPQCSAAGDQDTYIMVGAKAEERMQRLMFSDSIETGNESIGRRKQIARHIADAVTSVLQYMKDQVDYDPEFSHQMKHVKLSRRLISQEDVINALQESEEYKKQYELLLPEAKNFGIKENPKLYIDITYAYKGMIRGFGVKNRYELQMKQPKMPVEVHVLRIGDVAIATNPFELYLDYGVRIKARSPAVQTFLVQLCGSGSYVPTNRSIAGGGYGAVPASTQIGPEGGQELVESTLELINSLW